MLKICIVGVYWGRLPSYFQLWKKSAEYNSSIDFLIVTDQKLESLPINVHVLNMSFAQFRTLVDTAIGFSVALDSPYKCCDYKPAYGLIFKHFLNGYDYWGQCDFDMIFGDIRHFLESNKYYLYDKFLPLGHLSLYRNNEQNNHRFMESGGYIDYRTVFANNSNFAFDEYDGMYAIYKTGKYPFFDKRIFADIDQKFKRFRLSDHRDEQKEIKNYPCQTFYYENGKVYRAYVNKGAIIKEEYIYIHFQKRKNMFMEFDSNDVNAYYLTDVGFISKTEEVSIKMMKKINPYQGFLFEKFEIIKFNYAIQKKRLKRFVNRK